MYLPPARNQKNVDCSDEFMSRGEEGETLRDLRPGCENASDSNEAGGEKKKREYEGNRHRKGSRERGAENEYSNSDRREKRHHETYSHDRNRKERRVCEDDQRDNKRDRRGNRRDRDEIRGNGDERRRDRDGRRGNRDGRSGDRRDDGREDANKNRAYRDERRRGGHETRPDIKPNDLDKRSDRGLPEPNAKSAAFGLAIAESKEKSADKDKEKDKEKPNFALSGKLGEETNTYRGIVVKYGEPAEARVPKTKWRLYAFKGDVRLPVLHIHRQSAYLIGRERRIADIPIDHPSCSKQHAVLQYRLAAFAKSNGSTGRRVQLYLLDLGSANGTYVNAKRIDAEKYVQLLERDVIKFGFSSREYVLLRDDSVDSEADAED